MKINYVWICLDWRTWNISFYCVDDGEVICYECTEPFLVYGTHVEVYFDIYISHQYLSTSNIFAITDDQNKSVFFSPSIVYQ